MLQKICNILSGIIMVVLLVLAGLLIVPYLLGYDEMAVLTGSMQPTIPVGSLVYVREVQPETLEAGDVITYRLSGDTRVTHRVIEVKPEENCVVTQGDANDSPDGDIAFDRIVGKMDFSIPYLGFIAMNIRTKTGIMVICGVLIAIILLTFIPEIFAPEEKKEKTQSTATEIKSGDARQNP